MAGKFEMHFHGSVGEHIDTVKEMTVNIGSDGTVTKDKGDNTAAKEVAEKMPDIIEAISKKEPYEYKKGE